MSGRIISRAESWETVYQAFQNINFTAFDYQTIKQSMIDYIKLYFPETFSDYIESSEFIALLELFAYLGEITAYRIDMASHENFLPTAQRKQSILRLAKLISYNASRNIPARGLVKITSVSTTETVFDSFGNNLSGVRITWNDPSNPNWKDQFIQIFNKIFKQTFGSVLPKDRVQVQNVLFELYSLNNIPTENGVIPFVVNVSGKNYPMEIVPCSLNNEGPYEKRPEINSTLNVLYGSDGLGDGSIGTGFFFLVKQGTLHLFTQTFDGITPNQIYEIDIANINETDVWVNNVNPDTLEIVTGNEVYLRTNRAGEWVQVDLAHAQNIIYNTNLVRNKYEIETLEDDRIRIIFGDGEFAEIPKGLFHFWVRTSANEDLVIPQNAINNIEISLDYLDVLGNLQTLTLTFSATNAFQNAAKSEDLEHIRKMAPSVYYTQDRMVNGRDYNTFMLQDQTIYKIRSINRTFAGESNYVKYLTFRDPSGFYDNIKIFGDDLALYLREEELQLPEINPSYVSEVVLRNYIEPLLSKPSFYLSRASAGLGIDSRVRNFTVCEFNNFKDALDNIQDKTIYFVWRDVTSSSPCQQQTKNWEYVTVQPSDWFIKVVKGSDRDPWIVTYKSTRIVAESQETKFWFSNEDRVINYDSLHPGNDLIVLLKANPNKNYNGILPNNYNMIVLDHVYISTNDGPLAEVGLPNIHQFEVVYEDTNGDLYPDLPEQQNYIPLEDLINPEIEIDTTTTEPVFEYKLPNNILVLQNATFFDGRKQQNITVNDIEIITGNLATGMGNNGFDGPFPGIVDTIYFQPNQMVKIRINEHVYFTKPKEGEHYWTVMPLNSETLLQVLTDTENYFTRYSGRYPLNFMWMHRTPNNNLVDPAAMNIVDTYVITRGYYISMRRWLDGYLTSRPAEPTPQELRTSYSYLIDNKMISDSVVLHSGKFKVLFGSKAIPELQAKFKVIKSPLSVLTDNQIKLKIIATVKDFFDINKWEFGENFYFTELAAVIHAALPVDIESVVIVPLYPTNYFGDLFQVNCREDEIFIPDITINDIDIISSISRPEIRQFQPF